MPRLFAAVPASTVRPVVCPNCSLIIFNNCRLFSSTLTSQHPKPPWSLYALLSAFRSGVRLWGYPAAPRPPQRLLGPLSGGAVLGGARRAPVRPLRVGAALQPSPRAAETRPFRGGPVRRRALPVPLLTRR